MWRAPTSKPPPARASPTISAIGAAAAIWSNLPRDDWNSRPPDPDFGLPFLDAVSVGSARIGALPSLGSGGFQRNPVFRCPADRDRQGTRPHRSQRASGEVLQVAEWRCFGS